MYQLYLSKIFNFEKTNNIKYMVYWTILSWSVRLQFKEF